MGAVPNGTRDAYVSQMMVMAVLFHFKKVILRLDQGTRRLAKGPLLYDGGSVKGLVLDAWFL